MYQSSNRNGFLDILLDPMASGVLGSIALHAIIAASLPFLFQPDKPGKQAEPGSIKVVELTPSELQRIPQAPQPVAPQILPPVYQPKTPIPPAAPPRTPKISLAPQTIPASPIRTPAPKAAVKPPSTKEQKAKPQPQPAPPLFDRNETFQPAPVPIKPPDKGEIKPSPPLVKTPTKPVNQVAPIKPVKPIKQKPQSTPTEVDPNNTEEPPTAPQPSPSGKPGEPSETSKPAGSPNSPPGNQPSLNPKGNSNGGNPDYDLGATARLMELYKKYPDLKAYPTKNISQIYPPGMKCSKRKQPPFIVLMVAFDKVNPGQDANIIGDNTAPLLKDEKPYVGGDSAILKNEKLLEIATTAGFSDATTSDRNRPEADKNKRVLYRYRVEFDPASCK